MQLWRKATRKNFLFAIVNLRVRTEGLDRGYLSVDITVYWYGRAQTALLGLDYFSYEKLFQYCYFLMMKSLKFYIIIESIVFNLFKFIF